MGQHWYDSKGDPQHFLGKDGAATTLRQARTRAKEGDPIFPSVTTIGNIVSKFQLNQWIAQEAAMLATKMLPEDGEPDRAWARTVLKASSDKTEEKAKAGTDIHDILERHQGGIEYASEHQPMCEAVEALILKNTGLSMCDDFYAEMRFCDTEQGYAGMCDLHSKQLNGTFANGGKDEWVIDYKSKDDVNDKTRGWPEQAEQLAAYAHGLGRPNARIANIFISRSNPTDIKFFEHKDPMAWERFRHTLMLWQVSKKFGPYYESMNKA